MRIEWQNRARKQLKKIGSRRMIERILSAIDTYSAGGRSNVIALTNHKYTHRMRVGDVRVLMTVDSIMEISWIEQVRKRDDRTY